MNSKIPKLGVFGLVLVTFCGCAVEQQPAAQAPSASAEPAYAGVYIRRPTLVVKDMERALALYRDVLGLSVGRLGEDPPDSYVFTFFNIPADTTVMHATLDTDQGQRVLSLVSVPSMDAKVREDSLRTSAILINANGRLAAIREQLIKQGYTVLPSHTLGKTGTEFGFIDHDGHLIALYEFPPR